MVSARVPNSNAAPRPGASPFLPDSEQRLFRTEDPDKARAEMPHQPE